MENDFKIKLIMQFLNKHINRVGYKQAIKDLQYGLNIMNRKRKIFSDEKFKQIPEDGDFGVKTYSCLLNLCKYAKPEIIFRNIKKAAITNAVFDTKNDRRINTEKRIENINNDLNFQGDISE